MVRPTSGQPKLMDGVDGRVEASSFLCVCVVCVQGLPLDSVVLVDPNDSLTQGDEVRSERSFVT